MEQLGLTILDYAVQLLAAAAFALLVVAVRAGVNYLTTRIGGERVSLAMQLAATVVRALEQQGELLGFDGPRKKEMAIKGRLEIIRAAGEVAARRFIWPPALKLI